ncbi:hypothetical protein SLE2022_392600 [Rubroshorea leprosula]
MGFRYRDFLLLLCAVTFTNFDLAESANCYNNGNFTVNSTYGRNRDLALSSLASNTSENGGFYNTTVGEDPNKVYVQALCREDYNYAKDCFGCINSTIQDLITQCPSQIEAISMGDCVIHYANRPFFGILEQIPIVALYNTGNLTIDLNQFNQIWQSLLDSLVGNASAGPSRLKIAKGEARLTPFATIYAYMQCIPDLSQVYCNICLRRSMSDYQVCCNGQQGGVVAKPSCFLRWDLYPFFTSLPPPPGSPPLDSNSTNTTTVSENHLLIEVSKPKWIPIAASLSAVLGLALLSSFGFVIWRRRNSREDKENSQEVQLLDMRGGNFMNEYSNEDFQGDRVGGSQEFPLIQLDIINAATKHFCDENKLGEGGFGPVYKGTLADGKEIAVKRLSRTSGQGLQEFKNEVMLIARLQHRNLVRLLGCCMEDNETLLVYEYMPNRSLDVFLFDSSMSVQLDWQRRFSIIIGIARGIMYLHEDSRLKIIHRDLKASNILLDGEMNPKISDFGMARIFGGNQSEANTTRVVGTYGYMAPEYAMEGLFSVKSDIFSFGVLLLEILSGKKNNGFYFYERCESLLTFAWKLWSQGQEMQLIDPQLVQSCVESEVLKCVHIGLLCVQKDPVDRPTMSSVILMLGSETITLPKPTEPAFFVGRIAAEPALPSMDNIVCSVNEVTLSNVSPR